MNYSKIYNNLIARATDRVVDSYTERHHIVPRCLGGTDDLKNIVRLTPEEHYLVHQLLVKMHPGNPKLVYAAMLMTQSSNGKRTNNKLFGWIKRRLAEARSVPHSDEHKLNNSIAQTGKRLFNKTKAKMSTSRKGVPKSAEWAASIGAAQAGRKKTPEQIEKNRQAQLKLQAKKRVDKILAYYV